MGALHVPCYNPAQAHAKRPTPIEPKESEGPGEPAYVRRAYAYSKRVSVAPLGRHSEAFRAHARSPGSKNNASGAAWLYVSVEERTTRNTSTYVCVLAFSIALVAPR